jgi:hypothetical protein
LFFVAQRETAKYRIYQLSDRVSIEALKFVDADDRLSLTDGMGFMMKLAGIPHGGMA